MQRELAQNPRMLRLVRFLVHDYKTASSHQLPECGMISFCLALQYTLLDYFDKTTRRKQNADLG